MLHFRIVLTWFQIDKEVFSSTVQGPMQIIKFLIEGSVISVQIVA